MLTERHHLAVAGRRWAGVLAVKARSPEFLFEPGQQSRALRDGAGMRRTVGEVESPYPTGIHRGRRTKLRRAPLRSGEAK